MSVSGLQSLQIGFIVAANGAPMTGSERYFFDLARSLEQLGNPCRGLVVGDPSLVEQPVSGIESFAREGAGSFDRIRGLRRAVRRLSPISDVVATHSPAHAWPILDLIAEKPLVVHFHGPLTLEARAEGRRGFSVGKARFAETLTYSRARRFVVLSEANAETLRRHYGVAGERIRIVPGAVDTTRFRVAGTREEARRQLGWPIDRPLIVAARRLAPTKGIDLLISAMSDVVSKISDALLVLVGTGPLRTQYERQVAEAGLQRSVLFAGQLDETLPLAYRAANLSVVPSIALEGFGLSVVEALACGTPTMVTPVAGLPEVVADLDPRLILKEASHDEIAAGIIAALDGTLKLPDERACRSFSERFSWTTIAGRIAKVYDEVR